MSRKRDRRLGFARPPMLEALEERRLLSVFFISTGSGFTGGLNAGSPPPGISMGVGSGFGVAAPSHFETTSGVPQALLGRAILFSEAPDAVRTGLSDLAAAQNLAAPTDDQLVFLDNSNGVESYTLFIRDTGVFTRLKVDQLGNPISDPVKTTTDWLTFSTDHPAAASGILNIASVLNLTAPADDATVFVRTQDGASTFSVALRGSGRHHHSTFITVDDFGNPVGDGVRLPLNALPSAIQDGLIANAPAGVVLDPSSTQTVFLNRVDGVQTYSMTFRVDRHTRTTVTVDATGSLIDLPSRDLTTFDQVPPAAQAELQTLAADNGLDVIGDSTRVVVYTQLNGNSVYQALLQSSTGRRVSFSVDQDGNPTVPPRNDNFFFRF